MKRPATPMIHSLSTLVTLREREVERLQAEVAAKMALRQRYLNSLERLENLCRQDDARAALPPALSLNSGNYKQTVIEMADSHRVELALHEADMAVTQRSLGEARCRQEVLGKVLQKQQQRVQSAEERKELKRQDDIALQMWKRGQA